MLDALYVNNSGGKVLLDYLINRLLEREIDVFFLLDKRCEASYSNLNLKNVTFVESCLKNRKKFYLDDNKKFTSILCFANISPPIKCAGEVTTYFHNLLLSEIPSDTPLKKRILLLLKRYYAISVSSHSDRFVVQTEYAKQSFQRAFGKKKTEVIPFYNHFGIVPGPKSPQTFLYVSDGNPHKNHQRLLAAWQQVSPSAELWLTVSDQYPALQQQIADLKQSGLRVSNFTHLTRAQLNALYAEAEYQIYPSLLESFGLGLIEGALAGCKILASDLPHSYQVVAPSLVFDPYDEADIAQQVNKVLNDNPIKPSALLSKDGVDELIDLVRIKN